MRVETTVQDLLKLYRDACKKQKQNRYQNQMIYINDKTELQRKRKKQADPRPANKIRAFFQGKPKNLQVLLLM